MERNGAGCYARGRPIVIPDGTAKEEDRSVYDDVDNYEAGRGDYDNGDVNKEEDDDDDDVECVSKEKEFELNVQ